MPKCAEKRDSGRDCNTMTTQTAIEKAAPATLQEYMRQPAVIERFSGLLGNQREAEKYIQSVLIAVTTSENADLLECSHVSIARAALRAASLELSCDPAVKQAWLVPYNNRKTNKKEANFQPHYNGLRTLAMRTGRYSVINVSPIYEGSEVFEDVYTGLHVVQLDNGLNTSPEQVSRLRSVSARKGKVIGWLGYYRTTRGMEKTVYMSVEDIQTHIAKYNQYWQKSKAWRDHRETMEMKTVLLALLRTADLTGTAHEKLREALQDPEEVIDAETEDLPEGVTGDPESDPMPELSQDELLDQMGY